MTPDGQVLEGNCVELMAGLEPDSIDAIVTDPPYDLTSAKRGGLTLNIENPYGRARIGGFMGKAWDGTGVAFDPRTWAEALRVAKPGAYLLAFGGTRTYHRMATAIEDAGWEIRDCLVWAYASGFPKSLDVSKAIDAAAGATREVVGQRHVSNAAQGQGLGRGDLVTGTVRAGEIDVTAPATPEAARWAGWGTALKPAWEPIVLARKPLGGTVAATVTRYGTGALNIDATRIPITTADAEALSGENGFMRAGYERPPGTALEGSVDGSLKSVGANRPVTARNRAPVATDSPAGFGKGEAMGGDGSLLGRWPANVMLTDGIFDGGVEGVVGGGQQSGGGNPSWRSAEALDGSYNGAFAGGETGKVPVDTEGSYSRFFLIPKAARNDREPVLRGLIAPANMASGPPGAAKVCTNCGSRTLRGTEHICKPDCPEKVLVLEPSPRPADRENTHPTVKPTELMRHLVRLVTPQGGLVLDPFLGSGSTALAAEAEGFRWLGMEMEAEHVAIARARLPGTQRGMGL